MAESKMVPQLRFKGFIDDWEQRKLSDITSLITKGTTPLDKSGNGDINFVKVENIDNSNGEIISSSKITREEHEGYLKRSHLNENDILFSIAGTLGRVGVVKSSILPANTNQALSIIRLKEGCLNYIATVLRGNAVEEYIRRNPTIGAQPNLSLEQVSNLIVPYPTLDEQEKIGVFFEMIDNTITLHQRKYDKLLALKKSMLEKMFPKAGSDVPGIRFAGFTGAWEQRKLADMSAFITKGATPTTYGFQWVDEGIPFFRNDAIKDNRFVYGDYSYISEEANEALRRSEITGDDILIAITGDIGKVGIVPKTIEKANINQHTARVRIVRNAVPYFVYQALASEEQQKIYQKIKTGLSMPQLSLEQIRETTIPCPSIEEQTKIADTLMNLDKTITLHQRKYDKLKQLKQSLLGKMFV